MTCSSTKANKFGSLDSFIMCVRVLERCVCACKRDMLNRGHSLDTAILTSTPFLVDVRRLGFTVKEWRLIEFNVVTFSEVGTDRPHIDPCNGSIKAKLVGIQVPQHISICRLKRQ